VGKYLKTVTYQRVTPAASGAIAELSARLSRLEGFEAHARSCDLRVERWPSP
jgi:sulfopropanediol 3-dehydrogenase